MRSTHVAEGTTATILLLRLVSAASVNYAVETQTGIS